MIHTDMRALATELTREQIMELLARSFIIDQVTFIKHMMTSSEISEADRAQYTNDLAVAANLDQSVTDLMQNVGIEHDLGNLFTKFAGEYTEGEPVEVPDDDDGSPSQAPFWGSEDGRWIRADQRVGVACENVFNIPMWSTPNKR